MMKQYFDGLVSGIEAKLVKDPSSASARKTYALEISRLGSRLYDPAVPVSWGGVTTPFEVLNALGVTSCFVEFVGAMLASTGMADNFLAAAEQEGFGQDICGYHRGVLGAALQNMMPEPEFLIGTNCPCTGGLAVIENLAAHFDKPMFVLQIPQNVSEKNISYLAEQIRNMVAFVEKHKGVRMDPERLRSAVELTNEARAHMVRLYEAAQRVPSPARNKDLRNFGVVMALFLGTQAGVDVAKSMADDFESKVEKGIAGNPNERIRLLWIQNRIQFKNPIEDLLESQFGATIVADELNTITWQPIDPDDPYRGIAERIITIPFNGSVKNRIDHLQKMALNYKVHGAINPCHWGCRQGSGARGLVGKGLKEVGVPTLNLEVDCIDTRNFAEGQLMTRIEAFMETVENRKGF